jgi:hypothetical protein
MVTAPLIVALTFVMIRWRWVLEKAIATVDDPTSVPIAYTLVATVIGAVPWRNSPGFCSLPSVGWQPARLEPRCEVV